MHYDEVIEAAIKREIPVRVGILHRVINACCLPVWVVHLTYPLFTYRDGHRLVSVPRFYELKLSHYPLTFCMLGALDDVRPVPVLQ